MTIKEMRDLPRDMQELGSFFKALAGETRQRVLCMFLCAQELSVNEVAERIGIGQSTASESLDVLRRTGMLTARRSGRTVFYRADRARALELVEKLRRFLTTCCTD